MQGRKVAREHKGARAMFNHPPLPLNAKKFKELLKLHSQTDKISFVGPCYLFKIFHEKAERTTKVTLYAPPKYQIIYNGFILYFKIAYLRITEIKYQKSE